MQITFHQNIYTNNNQYKQNKTYGIRLKPQLTADTVSFRASRDLLKLKPETIFKRINKSIKNKNNFLGKGDEGTVYAIEDSPYCIKIPHFFHFGRPVDYKKSFSTELTEKDKINHVVAHLGDKAVIMKKIDGCTVLNNTDIAKELSQFPVSSYNKFLKQISHAHKNGMYFDAINQNVIINDKNKTITAIDFIDGKGITNDELLPLHSMYFSLVNRYIEPEFRKLVADKILDSALEEFKPQNKPCIDTSEFDFDNFLQITSKERNNPSEKDLSNSIRELIEVKDMELAGVNVKDKLAAVYTKTKELLNK